MGFFSALFGKKKPSIKTDRVFMTRAAANRDLAQGIEHYLTENRKIFLVYYFRETRNEIEKLFLDKSQINWVNGLQASFISGASDSRTIVVFAETYPDYELEQQMLNHLGQNGYNRKIVFYHSLEDPIFIPFGAERIQKMMHLMGIKEEEALEHRSITSSLDRAQKKLSDKKLLIHKTDSRVEMLNMLTALKK